MKPLPIAASLPHMTHDMTIVRAQMASTGAMPPSKGLDQDIVTQMQLCYVEYLMTDHRMVEAERHIEALLDDEERMANMPPLYAAWLWLANMTLLIHQENHSVALGAAENALTMLTQYTGKHNEDFLAIVASLLYNLAMAHHAMGDGSRAAKELTKAQQMLERLTKRNEARFSPLLLMAVEASTDVIKSKTKQMNVLAHYQTASELYQRELASGDTNATRTAMSQLVDTLGKQGDIMLEMGNSRNAVKYFTKALRYQKKLGDPMGERDLDLSIGLAKALMRLINRRAAAEQLLRSLQPLAQRLNATAQAHEIENLLNNKNKNFNIMTLLKSIFTIVIILLATVQAQAQLIVGHRGSQWGVENTRAAFINGAAAGAWGLECDIRQAVDGTFIVSHDNNLKRLNGPETALDQMSTVDVLNTPLTQRRHGITYAGNIITLADFLDLCNQLQVVPVIEIKYCPTIHGTTQDEDPVYDGIPSLIRMLDFKGCSDRAVIISFMPGVISFIHRRYPDIHVQQLVGEGDTTIGEWAQWCIDQGVDMDVQHTMLTREVLDQMHQAGLKVNVWTVDGEDDVKRLKQWGVDYITTNARFPHNPQ